MWATALSASGASSAVYTVASVLGILILAATAVVVLRSKSVTTSLSLLRGERDDLLSKIRRLETDRETDRVHLKAQDATIAALTERVTQAAAVTALTARIEEHHRENTETAKRHYDALMAAVTQRRLP